MADFEKAIEFVLVNEGGLVDNPNDSGKITNRGISLRFLQNLPIERLRRYGIFTPVSDQTIRDLTKEQTIFIYRGEFWDEENFSAVDSQALCNYIFDMAVSMGVAQAIKLVQRAISAYSLERVCVDDGLLGERTLGYINSIGAPLFFTLVAFREAFYRQLVDHDQGKGGFLDGWIERCYRI